MREQRHVVITGASSGIGAALTRALASDGFALYVCGRRADRLREVTEDNSIAFAYRCDVSRESQVRDFAEKISERTPHVDALINCAAVQGAIGPMLETDSRQWRETFDVNLFGTYLMTKYIAPLMDQERSPCIVNFSGGGAFDAFPNYSAYAVSKAAVVRMTENLAAELAETGIRVNSVAPGFVATEIHRATMHAGPKKAGAERFQETEARMKRGSIPMDVPVDCVRFLLSDRSIGLTGKTISASFDPWSTAEFADKIPQINESDLYTLRRINLVNLQVEELRADLEAASARRVPS